MTDGISADIRRLQIVERANTMTDIHQIERRIDPQEQPLDCACQVILGAKIGCKCENRHEQFAKVLLHQFAFLEKKLVCQFICQ